MSVPMWALSFPHRSATSVRKSTFRHRCRQHRSMTSVDPHPHRYRCETRAPTSVSDIGRRKNAYMACHGLCRTLRGTDSRSGSGWFSGFSWWFTLSGGHFQRATYKRVGAGLAVQLSTDPSKRSDGAAAGSQRPLSSKNEACAAAPPRGGPTTCESKYAVGCGRACTSSARLGAGGRVATTGSLFYKPHY